MKIWIMTKKDYFESFHSNRFKEEAEKEGIDLKFVAGEDFDIIVTKEGKKSIHYQGEGIDLPDCFIPRTGSGTNYFEFAVIRHIKGLGVLVLNDSSAIELAKDKLASLQSLVAHNIPIPKTMLAKFPLNTDIINAEFSYPCLLKTISGSYGKGVFLLENKNKSKDILDLMEISKDPKVNVVFQEFVSSSKGRDIRVYVIGGRAIGAILRTAKRGKFKANFSTGGRVEVFELNKTVEWLAVESARVLGLEVAGVDILFDGDNYTICEVNSAPGFEGFEQATKINIPKEFFEYVRLRLGEKTNP